MFHTKWACALILLAPFVQRAAAQTPSFKQTNLPAFSGCAPNGANPAYASIVTGDFNGDHKPDLAFFCPRPYPATQQVAIYLGNGDGTFQTPTSLSVPTLTGALAAADFNGDGRTDLALLQTNLDGTQNSILVWAASPSGTFLNPVISPSPIPFDIFTNSTKTADVNGDGIPDLIYFSGSLTKGALAVFFGKTDLTFPTGTVLAPSTSTLQFGSVVVGDFDKDGKQDIVATGELCCLSGRFATFLFPGVGSGNFLAPVGLANIGAVTILSADFNNDGKLDLAIGDLPSNSVYTLFGNGDGTFQGPVRTTGYRGPFAVADFNGDGKPDLAQAAGSTQTVPVLIGTGNGDFVPGPPVSLGDSPSNIVTADFNGDGKPDIATANFNSASILLNTTLFSAVKGVLNAASFALNQPINPGSLASVFGADFTTGATVSAPAVPLTNSLGGVSVTIGGIPAPLLFVGPTQINLQVPWNVPAGPADIVVSVNGAPLKAFRTTIGAFSPGIFTTQSGIGQAIAINLDGTLVAPAGSVAGVPSHPAKVGDAIIILGTGLGPVTPTIADGAAPTDTLRNTNTLPAVVIGGVGATVIFSGLSPEFVGVNQVNVIVPDVPPGMVPLQFNIGGIPTTDKVTIAVASQ